MTESSTWVSVRKEMKNLAVLSSAVDEFLVKIYHTLLQPRGHGEGGRLQIHRLRESSKEGQKIIRNYGKDLYGEGLTTTPNTPRSTTIDLQAKPGNPPAGDELPVSPSPVPTSLLTFARNSDLLLLEHVYLGPPIGTPLKGALDEREYVHHVGQALER